MTVTIKCLTPKGYEVTIPFYDYDPDGNIAAWFEDLASFDSALASRGFKPLPVPQYGGGGNRGGNNTAPKNWIEAEGNSLYVFFAWSGKDKAENDANKKAWIDKIQAATGVMGTTDHELFGKDSKGRDIWTYVYPVIKGREILEVLPADQFERKPKLQARLDAKKDK